LSAIRPHPPSGSARSLHFSFRVSVICLQVICFCPPSLRMIQQFSVLRDNRRHTAELHRSRDGGRNIVPLGSMPQFSIPQTF
jgi:hypothetical protein